VRIARSLAFVALLILAAVAGGCSSQPSMSSWQKDVSHYVADQGRGDPLVLRDMTIPGDGRPGFSVIGHHDTMQSVDLNGVLLGHERIDGRAWFVYLVGQVEKERVTDIRLAALSMRGGKSTWKRGKGSNQSLNTYRAFGEKQAKERFPDRKSLPPRYGGFPRPDDVFKLTNENGKLTATHEASGAWWELTLTGGKR
jgi:hypothetical protein